MIEKIPFTLILASGGLIVGLLLPSGLDLIQNYEINQTQIVQDPAGAITGYAVTTTAVLVETLSGLLGLFIMGIAGLFIDLIRNAGGASGL